MLTRESLRIFREWDAEVGLWLARVRGSGLRPDRRPGGRGRRCGHNVAALQGVGIETEVVSAAELAEIEPLMRVDDLTYGAYEPNSGFADPVGTLYGFVAAAQAGGATICPETEAIEILTEGDRVTGVSTNSGHDRHRHRRARGRRLGRQAADAARCRFEARAAPDQVAVFRQPPEVDPRRRHRVVIDTTQRLLVPAGGACLDLDRRGERVPAARP